MRRRRNGQIIYLAGNDGTGKTTQAELLLESLRREGVVARYVWLRFPHYVSLPVLALSRILGVTRYRSVAGRTIGRWEFYRVPWLAKLLLLCQGVDVRIARARWIDPLVRRGEVVVLDRFVYDIAVDLAAAARDPRLLESRQVRWLIAGLGQAQTLVFDAPTSVLRDRRPDLAADDLLDLRAHLYRSLARTMRLPLVDATASRDIVTRTVNGALGRVT